tara:strand:- start:5694 stop:6125 length:432 start_codon:yes stop_codon:yes gene_type:complete
MGVPVSGNPSVIFGTFNFGDVYVEIAELFELAALEPYNAPDHHYPDAVDVIIDISTESHTGDLFKISNELLYPLFDVLQHSRRGIVPDVFVTKFVRTINKFVTDNVDSNMDSFINSLSWTLGSVPGTWKAESELVGYDTTNWV